MRKIAGKLRCGNQISRRLKEQHNSYTVLQRPAMWLHSAATACRVAKCCTNSAPSRETATACCCIVPHRRGVCPCASRINGAAVEGGNGGHRVHGAFCIPQWVPGNNPPPKKQCFPWAIDLGKTLSKAGEDFGRGGAACYFSLVVLFWFALGLVQHLPLLSPLPSLLFPMPKSHFVLQVIFAVVLEL